MKDLRGRRLIVVVSWRHAVLGVGKVETGRLMRRNTRGAAGRRPSSDRKVDSWLSGRFPKGPRVRARYVPFAPFGVHGAPRRRPSHRLPCHCGWANSTGDERKTNEWLRESGESSRGQFLAAEKATSPPSNVTPTVSALAAEDDWGGDLQAASSCPTLGVSAATFNISKCIFGDKKSKTVVALVGDSRAQMWLDAFNTVAVAEHLKLVLIAKSGCPGAHWCVRDQ